MKDKLVTVFGGSGFIGRYAAQALLSAGARVRFAERDPRRALRLKPLGGLGQTQFVAADITRPDTVARAVDGANAVVNLVGVFGRDMVRVHLDGARAVAEAAAGAGAEALVHLSALGADRVSPSAYGRSKGEGEAAVSAAFPAATILRPSTVFGPEDQFLNRFAQMIARLPLVPVLKPRVRFQPVFAGDVGEAILKGVTEPGRFAGVTAELGGPDTLTMAELLHWIAAALHRRPGFVELPDMAGSLIARAGFLPGAPISWDQWLMLQRDNVVAGEDGLALFDVRPTPLDAVAPDWLVRYRRHGRFSRRAAETADRSA